MFVEIEGFYSDIAALEAVMRDEPGMANAICMNDECDYTCEMEHDASDGWCDECETNTIKSLPVLMGII